MKIGFQNIYSKWKLLPPFYKYLIAGIIYSMVFALIYLLEHSIGWIKVFPTIKNVATWDGGWYQEIKNEGYHFNSENPSAGFFPLLPYLWRWLHLSNYGICVLLLSVSLIGIAWLSSVLKPNWISFFIALSFPSLFYFALPYTESLFLFFSVMALVGWKKNNSLLMFTGIFLASLSRVSAIFLVMGMAVAIVFEIKNRKEILSAAVKIFSISFAVAIGILLVLWIQYSQTGVWSAYFKAQSTFWERNFKLPTFPMGSPGGRMVLWMQIFGLWLGLWSVIALIRILIIRYGKNIYSDSFFITACTFLALTWASEIFFNPTWWNEHSWSGTWLVGLSRYMFVNPFFFIFIFHLFDLPAKKFSILKIILILLGTLALYFCIIDMELSEKHVWIEYIIWVTTGLLAYFLAYIFKFKPLRFAVIIVQLFIQVYYAGFFLSGSNV